MANCIKLSNYTAAVTTITTIPKGMKVKYSEYISETIYFKDDNLTSICRLSKGHIDKNTLRPHRLSR